MVHAFPKVNVISRLEFELAYYDISVQDISHYATETPKKKVPFKAQRK